MRLLGMIGGMSWVSTAEYYRVANELVARRLGGHASARVLLHSVDFAPVEALQRAGDWHAAGELLADAARSLAAGGAELVLLCTNTMHVVADQVAGATTVPFLHIADPTAAAVRDAGLRRVGLLGTAFTMEQPFLREALAARGVETLVPEVEDRALVHRVIYDELTRGVVRESSRAAYRDVVDRLVAAGAEGIVLGCTEIELLLDERTDLGVPTFPTTRLHVEAAVDRALVPASSGSED